MKTLAKGALLISAIVTFSSCATEPVAQQPQDSSTTISLYSEGILTKAATDIQATQVVTGAKVGVFVHDGSAYIANGENNVHVMQSDATLKTGSTIKYPNSKVNIYAYAPYDADLSAGTLSFAVAADQSTDDNYLASDLLYASVKDVAESGEAVALQFAHKMAKIVLDINANDAISLAGATVTLNNVATSASLNVLTGDITTGTDKGSVNVAASASDRCAALIAPQEFAAADFVTIKTDDKTYTAKLGNTTFDGGKVYTYTINITTQAVIVSKNIADWTDGGSDSITIY